MGLIDILFGRLRQPKLGGVWQTVTGYQPVFTTWDGQMYESELVRAAIDALARHSGKLEVTVTGAANPKLRTRLRSQPNPFMTWYQYLYRVRTILECQNNCFIVPIYGPDGQEIEGFFPVLPSHCEVRETESGEPWLRYNFLSGTQAALPLDECGIMTRHQYKDDLFGSTNRALAATLDLANMQKQGITEGIKNGATFRFMARMTNFMKPEDLAKERKRFNADNLRDESGGILLFPNTYDNISQIKQVPYKVDAEQMKLINTNVFNYFGVNEDVLQNKCYGDAWSAFYEGGVETFAIQASEVHSAMTYTDKERGWGNKIMFTSNRLQYMTNSDKLNMAAMMVDRGVWNRDEARAVFNMPPLPDGQGQAYIIRGEYKDANGSVNRQEGVNDDAL